MFDAIGDLVSGLTASGDGWSFECSDLLVGVVAVATLGTAVILKDEIKEVVEKIVD